jgi:hypothetical protein
VNPVVCPLTPPGPPAPPPQAESTNTSGIAEVIDKYLE